MIDTDRLASWLDAAGFEGAGEPIEAIESRLQGSGYRALKEEASDAVVALLDTVRKRYEELRADEAALLRLLAEGADRARSASAPVLERMYERMGFVLPSAVEAHPSSPAS